MKFWKLQGIGNDFIAIDGRNDYIDNNTYGDLAKKVCHRRFSVGADGLLVVKDNDRMRQMWKWSIIILMEVEHPCVEMDLDVLPNLFMTII